MGVGGLAVALALQDTLSNLFSGFYVAVARQIRLGDYIRLNTGEEGYVTDIGWRSTTIESLNHNVILIPNDKLAQAIVTNFYLPEKRMAASVQVSVGYDSDPDHVERVLLDLARQGAFEIPGMLADPSPSVSFDPGFGESALVVHPQLPCSRIRRPICRPRRTAQAHPPPLPRGTYRHALPHARGVHGAAVGEFKQYSTTSVIIIHRSE